MTAFNKKVTPSLKIGKKKKRGVVIIAVCSLGATRYIYNRLSLFKSDRSGIIISISICVYVTIIKERNRLEGY